MLIAAIVGIDARATMDMDATIMGFELTKEELENIFNEILSIPMDDGVYMKLHRDNLNNDLLKEAFIRTSQNRGSYSNIKNNSIEYLQTIESSEILLTLWERYRTNNDYAMSIHWNDTFKSMLEAFNRINL